MRKISFVQKAHITVNTSIIVTRLATYAVAGRNLVSNLQLLMVHLTLLTSLLFLIVSAECTLLGGGGGGAFSPVVSEPANPLGPLSPPPRKIP